MSTYQSYKDGANRDCRDEFKQRSEYRATINPQPHPSSMRFNPQTHRKENQPPTNPRNPFKTPLRPSPIGYNPGNSFEEYIFQ